MALNMDFSSALHLMRAGCPVKRQANSADPRFIFLVPRGTIGHSIVGDNLDIVDSEGNVTTPAVDRLLIGTWQAWEDWQPTRDDILATDWMDA